MGQNKCAGFVVRRKWPAGRGGGQGYKGPDLML